MFCWYTGSFTVNTPNIIVWQLQPITDHCYHQQNYLILFFTLYNRDGAPGENVSRPKHPPVFNEFRAFLY